MRTKPCVLASGLLCLLAAGSASAAGARGSIAGSVTSRDGARLPGVALAITKAADGATYYRSTGSLGSFRLPDLEPGAYALRAALRRRSPSPSSWRPSARR